MKLMYSYRILTFFLFILIYIFVIIIILINFIFKDVYEPKQTSEKYRIFLTHYAIVNFPNNDNDIA